MGEVVIEAHGLTKDYGGGRGVFGIDLEITRGEVFGYVGTNGSGKTTTIRTMMGYIRSTSGSVSIEGLDSWKNAPEIMRHVSYVPGEIAFPAARNGTEFLELQAEYLGVHDYTYMNHLIELLQLDPSADLRRMSKGMKQKTALVAALMGDKDILVLDEPTTGLDPLMRDVFLDMVREEKRKGHTVFMSSHIFEEIEDVCDRVAMIKDGRLIDLVSLHDFKHPRNKRIEVRFEDGQACRRFATESGFHTDFSPNDPTTCAFDIELAQVNDLFRTLERYPVTGLHEEHHSLEEYFMDAYRKDAEAHA